VSDYLQLPKYLYLTDFQEIEDGKLCVIVTEGKVVGPERLVDPELGWMAKDIVCTESSRVFVFLWESYFAFSVRDESFVFPEKGRSPGPFVEITSSSYLNYLMENSMAVEERISLPLRHWHIACFNHVVDVVSTAAPVVR
jgi:hypothetical protein